MRVFCSGVKQGRLDSQKSNERFPFVLEKTRFSRFGSADTLADSQVTSITVLHQAYS